MHIIIIIVIVGLVIIIVIDKTALFGQLPSVDYSARFVYSWPGFSSFLPPRALTPLPTPSSHHNSGLSLFLDVTYHVPIF
jgi:hypothetical protein